MSRVKCNASYGIDIEKSLDELLRQARNPWLKDFALTNKADQVREDLHFLHFV